MRAFLQSITVASLAGALVGSLAACAAARPSQELPRAESGERYQLVWSDEFDGDGAPDPAHWTHENGFVRNQELQWYQPENASRRNGLLVIEGRRERRPNPRYVAPGSATEVPANRRWQNREFIDYTSSSINTRGRHSWLYGRFEMRARIDVRRGSWPAFWTLGTRGPWPHNGEVDIMEFYSDSLLFNVAWGGRTGPVWSTVIRKLEQFPAGWADQFHVWRMDWDDKAIKLYMDDELINTTELTRTINAPRPGTGSTALQNPFHGPAYILVNQAIGAHGGDPSATRFPIRYEVDYVRVYQTPSQVNATRAALASPGPTR